jgi:hypothetical protein
MLRTLTLATALLCLVSSDTAAQVVQRPTRPYRGLFGGGPTPDTNRSRSELTFASNLQLGYDTWLAPPGATVPTSPTQPRESGYTFTGAAALSYFRGRTQRSLTVDGLVRSNGYDGIDTGSTLGATALVSAVTNLGRATQLRASLEAGYEPTLVLGGEQPVAVDPAAPVVSAPDVTSGYLEQRSWSSGSSVSLDHRWTPRQTTTVGGAYTRQQYLDDLGYDMRSRAGHALHSWSFSRTSSVRLLYGFNESDFDLSDVLTTTTTDQNVELGFAYNRRLSPTRRLQIEARGGATHVDGLRPEDRSRLTYWVPSGGGSISLDVSRSWSIVGDYNRYVDVLQGVSQTSFAADSASASLNGLIGRRIEASLYATYSNGTSGGADTTGRFENYSGAVQVLYALARWCATTVNYDYYAYRFQDVADLPSGFPPDFDRQAIRVGFTVWLPLHGTHTDGGPSRGSRRN